MLDRSTFHISIELSGELYTSSILYKNTKSIDFFVLLPNDQIGEIKYYIYFGGTTYALAKMYEVVETNYHYQMILLTRSLNIFRADDITEKLLFMQFGSRKIVCRIPNRYEKT